VALPEAVSPPTGTLVSGEPLNGNVSVATSYRDRGGGVQSLALLVDGVQVMQRVVTSGGCRQPAVIAVPCPLSGRLALDFDTSSIPDGPHRAELELRDVAGNRAVVASLSIVVRNTPAAAAPLTPGRLAMKRYALRTRYGARAVLEGTLSDFGEAPIAGAQVQVESRPLMRNSTYTSFTTVLTDGSGSFVVPISRGPSRVFRLRYAASEVSAQVTVSAPIRLRVSPTRTRNGKWVYFRGSIPGTTADTRVELQARAGRRWVPFRTAKVSKGRFRARYKFTNTTTTQRYRFRAVVRKDPNFPYAPGTSPIVKVLVRP
jgi:hypothetical protein